MPRFTVHVDGRNNGIVDTLLDRFAPFGSYPEMGLRDFATALNDGRRTVGSFGWHHRIPDGYKSPETLEAERIDKLIPAGLIPGDVLELTKGDEIVRGALRAAPQPSTKRGNDVIVGEHTGATLRALVTKGYTVQVVKRAERPVELPTERGLYAVRYLSGTIGDKGNDPIYFLDSVGWSASDPWAMRSWRTLTAEQVRRELRKDHRTGLVPLKGVA